MSTPLLEIEDLSVEYVTEARTVRAVDRVTFSIAEREVFGLAGESGCGKSTIANAILRLLRDPAVIAGGSIRFAGTDVLALSADELRDFRWRQVAMVFQSAMNSLNPVMTIGDQIADIFTTHEGVSKKPAMRHGPVSCSSSWASPRDRLRVLPASALGRDAAARRHRDGPALRPPLLIMDEPTTALDVVVQQEIMAQIKELQQELGFSILFITHDISLMVELSDRMAIMYAGRFVETAPAPRDLRRLRSIPTPSALMNAFPPHDGSAHALFGASARA